jgi:hypothetical protein
MTIAIEGFALPVRGHAFAAMQLGTVREPLASPPVAQQYAAVRKVS